MDETRAHRHLFCGAINPAQPAIHCMLNAGHDGDHWCTGLGWSGGADGKAPELTATDKNDNTGAAAPRKESDEDI